MTEEFGYDKTHAENTKLSIDKILGSPTTAKRKKKTQEDKKRISFCKMIDQMVIAGERDIMMMEAYDVDLSKYSAPFYDIIDELFAMVFTKEQLDLINFFLYDRYTPDGRVLSLTDDTGRLVPFETSEDLWVVMNTLK